MLYTKERRGVSVFHRDGERKWLLGCYRQDGRRVCKPRPASYVTITIGHRPSQDELPPSETKYFVGRKWNVRKGTKLVAVVYDVKEVSQAEYHAWGRQCW